MSIPLLLVLVLVFVLVLLLLLLRIPLVRILSPVLTILNISAPQRIRPRVTILAILHQGSHASLFRLWLCLTLTPFNTPTRQGHTNG